MKISLKIVTPYGEYYKGEADYISACATTGMLGILPGHTPLIAPLKISRLVVKIKGQDHDFAIGGGVLVVEKEMTRLLLNSIESKEDIDLQRALDAKKRAEARLLEKEKYDSARAQAALTRAINRIEIKNEN